VVRRPNDFSNLWPRKISFKTGGVITCVMGIAIMPWRLLDNYKTFIFGWLGGYAAFLGPWLAYDLRLWVIRKRVLLFDDLYLRGGASIFCGFQLEAVAALASEAPWRWSLGFSALRFCTTIRGSSGYHRFIVIYYFLMSGLRTPNLGAQTNFSRPHTSRNHIRRSWTGNPNHARHHRSRLWGPRGPRACCQVIRFI